jgi:hypothetical protein
MMFPDILIRLVQLNRNRCLLNPTSWIISGENFAGGDADDYKNPVTVRDHKPSDPILRSALGSLPTLVRQMIYKRKIIFD